MDLNLYQQMITYVEYFQLGKDLEQLAEEGFYAVVAQVQDGQVGQGCVDQGFH